MDQVVRGTAPGRGGLQMGEDLLNEEELGFGVCGRWTRGGGGRKGKVHR